MACSITYAGNVCADQGVEVSFPSENSGLTLTSDRDCSRHSNTCPSVAICCIRLIIPNNLQAIYCASYLVHWGGLGWKGQTLATL